jgi:Icc-related predicted phosphoesterase
VLVIAGDLHTSRGILNSLDLVYNKVQKHIVFVPGNHCYYHSQKFHVDSLLREKYTGHPYIHVLNNSTWEHDDVVFIGSTGWWTQLEAKNVIQYMNDYVYIHDLIPANYGLDWGNKSSIFLTSTMNEYSYDFKKKWKMIVVTHNAPTYHSIDEEFANSILNPCFANHWEYMIYLYKPTVWIHGHIHGSKEHILDNTLILCNPYGYESVSGNSLNKFFDAHKTVVI